MPCVNVDSKKIQALLGAMKFTQDETRKEAEVGAVTGLAWTAVGGKTLTVEVTAIKGKGEVKLTGKLGDVMKESASAALTYLKANAEKYGLDVDALASTDLHVHVPDGATPKDGPSAGITIATAILSALTGKAARADVAMTGEITLRGKVLPIGGLKEKALAARRAKIQTVIIPEKNAREIDEFPDVLKRDVRFMPVSNVAEVFAYMFESPLTVDKPKRKRAVKPTPIPVPQETGKQDGVRC